MFFIHSSVETFRLLPTFILFSNLVPSCLPLPYPFIPPPSPCSCKHALLCLETPISLIPKALAYKQV